MDRDQSPRGGPGRAQGRATGPAPSLTPEHDWAAAAGVIHPALRPSGTTGIDGRSLQAASGAGLPGKPLILAGPANLTIGYVIPGRGFGIHVGADHLLAWGVGADAVHAAAMGNLAAWSAGAPWDEETNARQRIVWSESSSGMDAARILLPEVRTRLEQDLGGTGRVIVGLPERDLLIATSIGAGDDDFTSTFAAYVAGRFESGDEPLDSRLFEIEGGRLVEFPRS